LIQLLPHQLGRSLVLPAPKLHAQLNRPPILHAMPPQHRPNLPQPFAESHVAPKVLSYYFLNLFYLLRQKLVHRVLMKEDSELLLHIEDFLVKHVQLLLLVFP